MNNKKINVGILFGGKSSEHEVSLQSAKNVFEAMDKKKYSPVLIGIDKSGKWFLMEDAEFFQNSDLKLVKLSEAGEEAALIPESKGKIFNIARNEYGPQADVIFPILHGAFGEDGTVQGLLKLADVPFVGAGVLGSAVGMDKEAMKCLLRDAGIPIGKFISVNADEPLPDYEFVIGKVGTPCFIKPANAGSSVGVGKAASESEYLCAAEEAFRYDNKILIEEFIGGREIECAVLGNNNPVASVPGEVKTSHEFYSYDAKYIDEKGADIIIPAKISPETAAKIQELAIKTFQALFCEGLGRVDSFLKSNGEIIVNEINTIPGFTKISMYPKLWEASGISYAELIDKLIGFAMERHIKEQHLRTNYIE